MHPCGWASYSRLQRSASVNRPLENDGPWLPVCSPRCEIIRARPPKLLPSVGCDRKPELHLSVAGGIGKTVTVRGARLGDCCCLRDGRRIYCGRLVPRPPGTAAMFIDGGTGRGTGKRSPLKCEILTLTLWVLHGNNEVKSRWRPPPFGHSGVSAASGILGKPGTYQTSPGGWDLRYPRPKTEVSVDLV